MTAIAVAPALRGADRWASLTGTWLLIRLAVRRDRISLAVWILGIAAVAAATFAAFAELYPNEPERVAFAASIDANPAFLALVGPIADPSIGGLTAWRLGVLAGTLIGLMAIVTVVRHTRADEETGRAELLGSGVLGRAAPLAAAVTVATAAAVLIGLITAVAGIAAGEQPAGSVALGASFAAAGLVFAAVAGVTVQLVESARTAIALGAAVLAVGFALRAVGDMAGASDEGLAWLGWLGWLSPQGWVQRVEPYSANNVLALLLSVLVAAALLVLAGRLLGRRDLGLALLATRLGRASNPRLASSGALAARLQRGQLLGWTVGLTFFGVVIGGIAASAGELLAGNPQMERVLAQIGGAGALVDVFLAAMAAFVGIVVGGYAVSSALRMAGEEQQDRVGPVLATSVARPAWMAGHVLFVIVGPVLVLTVGGLVGGLVHGLRIGSVPDGLIAVLGSLLGQLPAIWVMGAVATALYGWFPRWVALAWAFLAISLLLGQLGPLLQLPSVVMDLSPYAHLPGLPSQPMSWPPVVILTAVAAGLFAVGFAGFRRRDVS